MTKEIIQIPSWQMETKNLTLGNYDYTETQLNVITLIQEQLKAYMTKDASQAAEVTLDSVGEPYVVLDVDQINGRKNKQYVIDEVEKMWGKPIRFRWRHDQWGKNIKTSCPIVTAVHDVEGTSTIKINYNRWAIPFLIWYGKEVGGTFYDKTVALSISGKYTKRIYKLICAYRDHKVYKYNIDKFRDDFNISPSYSNTKIKTRILDKAVKDVAGSNSDVTFTYEFHKEKNGKSKSSVTEIWFYPKPRKKDRNKLSKEEHNTYVRVQGIIGYCGVPVDKIVEVCDMLMDYRLMDLVTEKWDYYDDCITDGKTMSNGQPYTTAVRKNIMRKLLREELTNRGIDPQKIQYLYTSKKA